MSPGRYLYGGVTVRSSKALGEDVQSPGRAGFQGFPKKFRGIFACHCDITTRADDISGTRRSKCGRTKLNNDSKK